MSIRNKYGVRRIIIVIVKIIMVINTDYTSRRLMVDPLGRLRGSSGYR